MVVYMITDYRLQFFLSEKIYNLELTIYIFINIYIVSCWNTKKMGKSKKNNCNL